MARRRLSDYRNDNLIKTPGLAWLIDTFLMPAIVIMAIVSVIATMAIFRNGLTSYADMMKKPVSTSPYLSITATQSSAQQWASQMISQNPGYPTWTVSDSIKPQHIDDPSNCIGENKIPITVLNSYKADNGAKTSATIQIYGAGQAIAQFNSYVNMMKKCGISQDVQEIQDRGKIFTYGNSFILTMGDSIISVSASDKTQRDNLSNFYQEQGSNSLLASSCIMLNIPNGSETRSFYYDKEKYTGLLETQTLNSQVDTNNIPNITSLTLDSIVDEKVDKPEEPLPVDFPVLPDEIDKPTIPETIEKQDSFTIDSTYQINDLNGPGCGWGWSAQKSPVLSENDLTNKKNDTLLNSQIEVDEKAQSYVNSNVDWAEQVALLSPDVDSYNRYVQQVNTVHERWNWLNSERNKIYDDWVQYVKEHNDWLTFDSRKATAVNKYNEALNTCLADQQELQDWETEWGALYEQQQAGTTTTTPVPTATTDPNATATDPNATATATAEPTAAATTAPVDIPERPAGCSTLPEKASIVDQEKPAEPQAPIIPEGVTIPDSWPQPNV